MLVPGTGFNQNRDKLFFFFSQDLLPRNDPGTLQLSTMPTALERSGDFSQTFDSQGRVRWIRDPNLAAQGSGVQRQYRRAWLLPGQPDSGRPHQRRSVSGC